MTKLDSLNMDSLKEVGSRIRWKSVLAVLFILIIVILVFRSFPTGYAVKDDVGLKAYANPDAIAPGGKTRLEVEVKNTNQDREAVIIITARAYDERLVFSNTSSTEIETTVKVGPKEARRMSFDLNLLSGALKGVYRINLTAREESKIEGARQAVYINVEE